ncbi:MAG: universal stress protein [Kiloniellales bacterium]|nr:universal stress protein [Kiloniellales bacterium]
MTIATVLALLDGDPGCESALGTGLDLAERHGAYIEALHVRPGSEEMIPIIADGLSAQAMEQIISSTERAVEDRAKHARSLFDSLTKKRKVPVVQPDAAVNGSRFAAAWHEITGHPQTLAAHRARLFDLIITRRPVADDTASAWTNLESVLFDSGRPVIVAPPNGPPEGAAAAPGRHIAIAWNDTRESARSAWAAEPFLSSADVVTLISITDRDGNANPAELAKTLRHRKVDAQVVTLAARDRAVGELLLEQASDLGADLLVMGAYGHSRLREFAFGGATRSALRDATIPVLMTH